jgi:hypothetical protein
MTKRPDPLIRELEVVQLELAELRMAGPQFVIIHRFREPGVLGCTPGEETADILLHRGHRATSLRLPTIARLLFEYLARNRYSPQSAEQIALGMEKDSFIQEQGLHAKSGAKLKTTISRAAVKQHIMRMRKRLGELFRRLGINLDPTRVLVSVETETNEVRYRLRAFVTWLHPEDAISFGDPNG